MLKPKAASKEKFGWIKWIDNFVMKVAILLGVWIAPIASGMIYKTEFTIGFQDKMEYAAFAGWAAGGGIIIAGAATTHMAIEALRVRHLIPNWLFNLLWVLVVGYVSLEIVGLVALGSSRQVIVVGTVSVLVTFITYLSRALSSYVSILIEKSEAQEADLKRQAQAKHQDEVLREEREYKRKIEEDEREFQKAQRAKQAEHERKLERDAAKTERELKTLNAQAAQFTAQKTAQIEHGIEHKIEQGNLSSVEQLSMHKEALLNSLSPKLTSILVLFSADEELTKSEVAQKLSISRNTASSRIEQLVSRGLLKKSGKGWVKIEQAENATLSMNAQQNGTH
jgi:flagellar biosynthesis GTPase FlhF